jgi:hypothetical protein
MEKSAADSGASRTIDSRVGWSRVRARVDARLDLLKTWYFIRRLGWEDLEDAFVVLYISEARKERRETKKWTKNNDKPSHETMRMRAVRKRVHPGKGKGPSIQFPKNRSLLSNSTIFLLENFLSTSAFLCCFISEEYSVRLSFPQLFHL